MENPPQHDWCDAVQSEFREIETRRSAAFPERAGAKVPDQEGKGLVGLALSGGGVRSAAFQLGLVQSLHRSGLLRWIDYLSSVSGGSYVGGMVTESIHRRRRYGRDVFDLAMDEQGRQPEFVRKVSSRGNVLFRLDRMANRYAIGLLLNLIPIISGLIAFGAGIAWL